MRIASPSMIGPAAHVRDPHDRHQADDGIEPHRGTKALSIGRADASVRATDSVVSSAEYV
jgi:hypothetical protein